MLVGNHEELGSWDLNRGRYMTWKDDHAWVANVTLTLDGHSAAHAISYKYAVVTLNDGQVGMPGGCAWAGACPMKALVLAGR